MGRTRPDRPAEHREREPAGSTPTRTSGCDCHLKVLVVVRIDAETGDEAVHHELHVCVLAACAPPERLGGVEEQSLVGTSAFETEATLRRHVTDGQGRGQVETFRSMTMDWTRRKMVE